MKLTIQLRLLPTAAQTKLLVATMRAFNAAATFAARVAFDAGVFSKPSVHKLAYREIRSRFGLSSQLAIHATLKAVECFAISKASCPSFNAGGAISFDERNMSFKGVDKVSLSTIQGREIIAMAYGEYQRDRLGRLKGQCDLVCRGGKWFLMATVDLPEPPPDGVKEFLGVDLGIVSLAVDSDGNAYSGKPIDDVRRKHKLQRKRLQRRGTKGATKKLKRLAGKESRFRKAENHRISKRLVLTAKRTDRGIAIEDLNGIRERVTAQSGEARDRLSGWAFSQLRKFISYKCRMYGVPLVAVDPRNTSRTCSECGHCEKSNRKEQDRFSCLACGFTCNADWNAAKNLAALGSGPVNRPTALAG